MLASFTIEFLGKPFEFGYWEILGALGQLMFASRFVVQWVISERKKESVIPIAFWYLSLVGSIIMLIYGFHRGEPIFTLGFLFNSVVYSRNLMLIYGRRRLAVSEEGLKI